MSPNDANAYLERCHHFFAALFAEMESKLTTLRKDNKTRDEVIASWSKIMLAKDQSGYNEFFANVDTRCQKVRILPHGLVTYSCSIVHSI